MVKTRIYYGLEVGRLVLESNFYAQEKFVLESDYLLLQAKLDKAVVALEEIANDEEESSHERAETALWAAKSALKSIAEIGKG
jgi:uncharacterized protein (UPF0147 family)